MRAPSFIAPTILLAIFASTPAVAVCPGWMTGPFATTTLVGPNGTDATVLSTTTWDPDGAGPLQPELVIAGNFSSVQSTIAYGIAARDPATGLWSPLGGGVVGHIYAMTVYNGDLIAAGDISSIDGTSVNMIARWDGSAWHPLGTGIQGGVYVRCLTTWNGLLIAGGTFSNAGGTPVSNIAAWDGSAWQDIGGGTDQTYVLALTTWNGNLVAGGNFIHAGGAPAVGVASWNGSTWSAFGSGVPGAVIGFQPFNGLLYALTYNTIYNWNGASWGASPAFPNTQFNAITARTGAMFVAGIVTSGGIAINGVFQTDGNSLTNLGASGGIPGTIWALNFLGNELVALGAFTTADGRPAHNMAMWDGVTWGSFGGGVAQNVQAITLYLGREVAGGSFHLSLLTMTEAHNVIGWDGINANSYGTGMDGPVGALHTYTTGSFANRSFVLVAGGSFQHAGGVAAQGIARWSQSNVQITPPAWAPMGPGFNGTVSAIERYNNVVVAGGVFTTDGDLNPLNYIGSFNESSQMWTSMAGGMNGPVYALKVFGSYLYAGGSFTTAGGVSTGGLARWDGTSWSTVGVFFAGTVNALEIHNGQLVIGGAFPGLPGSPNIVQFDGVNYTTIGTGGANSAVLALHSTGARLYAGGEFTNMGGGTANYVAYWDGTWHMPTGGTNNNVYALGHTANHVDVGGSFTAEDFGSMNTSPVWARYDETGIPTFRQQPASQAASAGATVSFTAVPDTGYTGLSLRWYHNGAPLSDGPTWQGSTIAGSSTEVLDVENIAGADQGNYFMVVTNACGSDTSATAVLSGVAGVDNLGAPAANAIEALGPNPSRGATQVEFTLARTSHVRLEVRDAAGRMVRSMDTGTLTAGHHQSVWDARGADGQRARPGVYFVGLEIDGRLFAARRLTIVR